MKKIKQILAIITIVILLSLYVITLICAITDQTDTMKFFFASVIATFLVPVLIWAYTFIYRLIKEHTTSKMSPSDSKQPAEGSDSPEQSDRP